MSAFSLGLDFGTSSARALIVRVEDGAEVGLHVGPFERGLNGVIVDARDPHLARQHPDDYARALTEAVRGAVEKAKETADFDPSRIVGIGVDATASTPIPVDSSLEPLANRPEFQDDLNAYAWLWKDHTAHDEADEITARAAADYPKLLAKSGGTYSSEWYYAKLLHCLRHAPNVMKAADGWVEQGDYVVGLLTGCPSPRKLKRNICAAGHKAMFDPEAKFPSMEFLSSVDERLRVWCKDRLYSEAFPAGRVAGHLCDTWAKTLGIPAGTPVSFAAIDAHVGAVGAGIRPGVLVKILGTSGCDMAVHPASEPLDDIPGLCGVVKDSILPGHFGLEAGQPAVGDLFGWFVQAFGKPAGLSHDSLTALATQLRAGESGLLALDWNNGNRSLLADARLTGLLVGQTLQTRPEEVYRALLEASAFGARMIMEHFEAHRVAVRQLVLSGGISKKNSLLLRVYADVTRRPVQVTRSAQTTALGAAIFGAVAAGRAGGGHESVAAAQDAMCALEPTRYESASEVSAVYDELFALYRQLHDAFGTSAQVDLSGVMKQLIRLRQATRKQ